MPAKYSVLSIDPIEEDPEDDAQRELRGRDDDSNADSSLPHSSSADVAYYSTRPNMGKERERSRRQHRGKHSHRSKNPSKRGGGLPRERSLDCSRTRRRRTSSNRSGSSASSSEDEEEPIQDHREVLAAARAQLTSPSMISAFTTLTATTNQSSGSSGSNSTVTQSSVSKRSVGNRPEYPEDPISPAVPDAPDVFEFLEETSQVPADEGEDESEGSEDEQHEEHDEDNDEDDEDSHDSDSQWPPHEDGYAHSPRAPILTPDTSSSGTSSLHGSDHFSETPVDHDTDRSTSPETSVKDHGSDHEVEPEPPSPASVKFASQLAAAQQRQNAHIAMQNFNATNGRREAMYHYVPPATSTAISPLYQQQLSARPPPRAERVPATGYELLASRLSSHAASVEDGNENKIKPIYRKFEALNHRLLLHLQDEVSELEEQLHRLDSADTQSRRAGVDGSILPASRRAAQAAGGELQWHKTDILGRIGFKLAQYNQALAAFNTTSSLTPPAPTDITVYRDYLHTAHPIAEMETRFLDPADDLVSVCSSVPASSVAASQTQTVTQNMYTATTLKQKAAEVRDVPGQTLTASAIAVAVAVLIPILTFPIIPGFFGRLTVISLVAGGVMGSLIQAGVLTAGYLLEKDGLVCGGIYLAGMAMIATIMG